MNDTFLLGLPQHLLDAEERPTLGTPVLLPCEVHDVIAYGQCYIVKPVGMPRMPALLGSLSSSRLPIGSRDVSTIIPGAMVLCWVSDTYYPVILSVLASPVGSSQASWPDSIVAAGHAGMFADPAHQIAASKDTSHGFLDFSAGGPVDGLPGDWGHLNELGMGVLLGKLMVAIRAGDMAKLEFFHPDMLARLVAYNFQHYTAGSALEAFNDEGEWTQIKQSTPFPWEALGVSRPGTEIFTLNTAADPKQSEVFGVEPADPMQASLARICKLEGFLGDLRRSFVLLPNTGVARMTYGREKGDLAAYKGLFEEILGLDGGYRLRSAKNVILEKTVWIPVPEEKYPRDNPRGDHDMSDVAGINMDFTEYPPVESPDELQARQRDRSAHDVNKRRSEPLNKRDKDWNFRDGTTEEDGVLQAPGGFTNEIAPLSPYPEFSQPLPPSEDEVIEPASGRKSRYFKGKAEIGIDDDGSIFLRDAYGAEIRLVGGNIEISCPGDIVMRTGKTAQIWGGKDVIVKAHDNLEMSTATGSARLKAEHNLMILGGNNSRGGVLIENRGDMPLNFTENGDSAVIGGLMLKSKGTLGMWADDMYLRSIAGTITFDANDGANDIVMYGASFTRYLRTSSLEVIAPKGVDTPEAQLSSVTHAPSGFTFMGGAVTLGTSSVDILNYRGSGSRINTTIGIKGSLTVEGNISGTTVAEVDPPTNSQYPALKESMTQDMAGTRDGYRSADSEDHDDGKRGDISTFRLIGFSFRSSDSLNMGNMVLFETAWQKRFRQSGGTPATGEYRGATWEESVVNSSADDASKPTMPFPGLEAWNDGEGAEYAQVDDQFYESDGSGGKPKPRGVQGANYSTVEPPEVQKAGFKDRYPINR